MPRPKPLAILSFLVMLVIWTVTYCHGFIGKPEIQSEIRKFKSADPTADAKAALAAGDLRFAVIGGDPMRYPGTNGVATRVFGWDCVAATHCSEGGPQSDRLIRVATEYAYEYNDQLLPELFGLEEQRLEGLERMLAADPRRSRLFEYDWQRATQHLDEVYWQIDYARPRYGGPWRTRERQCWELFLMRYRCWALEAELGLGPAEGEHPWLVARPHDRVLGRSEILDELAAWIDAVRSHARRRPFYDGWTLPR